MVESSVFTEQGGGGGTGQTELLFRFFTAIWTAPLGCQMCDLWRVLAYNSSVLCWKPYDHNQFHDVAYKMVNKKIGVKKNSK